MSQLLTLGQAPVAPPDLVPIRFREVGGDVLLTNPWGDWIFVTPSQLADLARGRLDEGGELRARLAEKGFLRSKVDVEKVAAALRHKKRFLNYGPNLHLFIVTLRCNE